MSLLPLLLMPALASPLGTSRLIDDTISRQTSRIRHCYTRARLLEPELSGKLVVNFTIRNGTARDVHLERDDIGNEALSACVQDAFWLMSFPISDAGSRELVVRYPFVFLPREERESGG